MGGGGDVVGGWVGGGAVDGRGAVCAVVVGGGGVVVGGGGSVVVVVVVVVVGAEVVVVVVVGGVVVGVAVVGAASVVAAGVVVVMGSGAVSCEAEVVLGGEADGAVAVEDVLSESLPQLAASSARGISRLRAREVHGEGAHELALVHASMREQDIGVICHSLQFLCICHVTGLHRSPRLISQRPSASEGCALWCRSCSRTGSSRRN